MKNLFMAVALIAFISLNACGQSDKDVPANIKTAFAQKFPKASKVKWGKENDKEWEAEFKLEGREYSANFDLDGNWMETELEIGANEIPAPVKETLDKEFAGFKVGECEVSETPDGKVFEFELKKGREKAEISIDENGKVITKEQGKEKDEDDED